MDHQAKSWKIEGELLNFNLKGIIKPSTNYLIYILEIYGGAVYVKSRIQGDKPDLIAESTKVAARIKTAPFNKGGDG